jgi:predicted DNA-binding protein (UPF0251 family)
MTSQVYSENEIALLQRSGLRFRSRLEERRRAMAQNQVPDSLPAGFREIWEALRVADDESPSRQVLARRLGISTHTVQRILVDGDVPDLAATTNTRVLRAWVRIITRLAHAFGRDGRAWVEAA